MQRPREAEEQRQRRDGGQQSHTVAAAPTVRAAAGRARPARYLLLR